uniref:WH2 domain-containing protein n=1 Tax=Anopheles maculatus TaxID=74869 RepID=A0A182SA77_9DIPT
MQQNKTPSPEASKGSPINNGRVGNGGGGSAAPLDFSDELAQKLTLKKQKQQHSSNSNSSYSSNASSSAINPPPAAVPNETNLRLNRGPPPQPPTSIQRPSGDIASSKTASSASSQKR